MSKISVVLVAYNHQQYIAEAVNSILAQTMKDFELIIVNDGSTDNTDAIINQFNDPRIRYIYQKNQGPSSALNTGCLAATADYIAFMSGDDVCEHNRLEVQCQYIQNNPNVRAVFSHAQCINDDGHLLDSHPLLSIFNQDSIYTQSDMLRYFFFKGNFLCAPTGMIEKKLLNEIGLFDVSSIQLQDYAAWVKIIKICPIDVLTNKLVRYRVRNNDLNLSSVKNDTRMLNENFLIMKSFFDDMPIKLFKKSFSSYIKNAEFISDIEYELEKAFVYLQHSSSRIKFLAYEKLYVMLQQSDFLAVAKEQYHFDLLSLYSLADNNFYPQTLPQSISLKHKLIKAIKKVRDLIAFPLAFFFKKIKIIDEQYYFNRYPDIKKAGISPALHYIKYGFIEGRTPSKKVEPLCESSLAKYYFNKAFSLLYPNKVYVKILPVINISSNVSGEIGSWCTVDSIAPSYPYQFDEPTYIGSDSNLKTVNRLVDVPSKWIATLKNVTIVSGYQVVSNSFFVLYEPAANPEFGFVAGLWNSVYLLNSTNNNQVVVVHRYKKTAHLKQGILISGRCSPNYFHFLIEYLTKMYVIAQRSELSWIPLIVDARMKDQQFTALKLIVGDWPLYRLDNKNVLLTVDKLYIPSIATFHPDNFIKIPFWQGSAICHASLDFMRDKILTALNLKNIAHSNRKIYLSRAGGRNIINIDEIENVLIEKGFEIISPETLSFEEQVTLFRSASTIVGPVGAAFSNLIFCQPRTKVLGLITPFGKGYALQANLAKYAGCDYFLLSGIQPKSNKNESVVYDDTMEGLSIIHHDFLINKDELINALSKLNCMSPCLSERLVVA